MKKQHTDQRDDEEELVGQYTLEDVELVVETSAVDRVEDLHEHERVEDERAQLGMFLRLLIRRKTKVAKYRVPSKVEDQDDDDLVDRLPEDHLVHVDAEQRGTRMIRFAVEKCGMCRVSGEGQGSERVHDDVDPQQLHGGECRSLRIRRHSSDKSDNDGGDVDGDLELQELLDGVVDASAPHDGADDRGEVVVHEDDVRRFLRDFRSSNTHGEPDVGLFEREGVVRSITSDTYNFAASLECSDQNALVLGG